MSPARSNDTPDLDEHELDEIAGELYAMRPDGFIAARDERVKQARAEGKAPLARALAALRRPTQSAWLVNVLARDQQDVLQELFELGDQLGRAHRKASGADLQELSKQRRKLEAALLRRARSLASDAGVDVTADMSREVEETLGAALVQPAVAEEVQAGRLVKPVANAGFGMMLSAVPAAPERQGHEAQRKKATPKAAKSTAEERRHERRADAERRVEDAREFLEAAESDLADQDRAAEEAEQGVVELRERLDELREELRDVEKRLEAAERGARVEARRRDGVRKSHVEARSELDSAERALRALED
jgi:DNA repair exonuclease SbcCD ATPase subunit